VYTVQVKHLKDTIGQTSVIK